jgi:hypothetical protein
MNTQPSADELLRAVSEFIERIAPDLKDRDIFLARVAVNALGVVRRELKTGPKADAEAVARMRPLLGVDGDFSTLNAALCEEIRQGAFDLADRALMDHLKACAIDQVQIDQPNYSGLKSAGPP